MSKHFKLTNSRIVTDYLIFDSFFEESLPPVEPLPSQGEGKALAGIGEAAQGAGLPPLRDAGGVDPLAPYRADEEEFYTQRAKLYCFNDNEWQDAGAGQVSFLRGSATGRVRLAFVQEGTANVIANHFIVGDSPFCELQRHTSGNDKTWMWTAKERVLERRFALKFKSPGEAAAFKDVFDGVKRQIAEADAVEYVVLRKVGATAQSDVRSRHVKLVAPGSVVGVLEVLYLSEERRVRARLAKTAGWITILSHNTADAATYAVAHSDMEHYLEQTRGR